MGFGRRSFLRIAGLWALPHLAAGAGVASAAVHVVLGPDSERQQAILRALSERFPKLVADMDAAALTSVAPRPIAYIAVGPAALQAAVAARLNAPLISTFTSRQGYERIVAQGAFEGRATAIYAEPSPAHQMRLISALYKRNVIVGVLFSAQSAFMEPLLQQAAADHRLNLISTIAHMDASLSRNLLRLDSATVVLIFPDSTLYTAVSLRELLETTYRRRQAVIGFSESLVVAGTLASAYSDLDDTMTQLQTVVAAIAEGRVPEPQYPRYWRVAINESVAHSFDVVVDDAVRRLGDRP